MPKYVPEDEDDPDWLEPLIFLVVMVLCLAVLGAQWFVR